LSSSDAPLPHTNYKWKEISGLPNDLEIYRDRELEALCVVWSEQQRVLGDSDSLRKFNQQLIREWAIETGIIEDVYTLDRGITQSLIEHGIEAAYIPHGTTNRDPELVAKIIQSHQDVLEGLFAFVKGERNLTTGYIKELPAALLRYQTNFIVFDQFDRPFEKELEKGVYKSLPNNPRTLDGSVHEYCPPEHVASEMDRLIELHEAHEKRGVRPELEAAWLHHAFTQVHPFQDGNGRVARTLATIVFVKAGHFPLVITRDDRERYIDTLAFADGGDLVPLVALFSQLQKRALTKAIGLAVDARPIETVNQAVDTLRDLLVGQGKVVPAQWLQAKAAATNLGDQARRRLNDISSMLVREITSGNEDFQFGIEVLKAPPIEEIRTVSTKLDYERNFAAHHNSLVLNLRTAAVSGRIVVSFHGVGPFKGVLVAMAYLAIAYKESSPLSDDVFRISYEEPFGEMQNRFDRWLENCIIKGLELWRRSLV
jgi:hypothetical protein